MNGSCDCNLILDGRAVTMEELEQKVGIGPMPEDNGMSKEELWRIIQRLDAGDQMDVEDNSNASGVDPSQTALDEMTERLSLQFKRIDIDPSMCMLCWQSLSGSVSLSLRSYQTEIVSRYIRMEWFKSDCKNVIIYAPTGTGKTAIAAEIMATTLLYSKLNNLKKKAVFLVPRVALAYQQSVQLQTWIMKEFSVGFIVGGQAPSVRQRIVRRDVVCR